MVTRSLDVNIMAFGARALLEQGRSIAADAFVELQSMDSDLDGQMLILTMNKESQVELKRELSKQ